MPIIRVFYRMNIACALIATAFIFVLPFYPSLYSHSSSSFIIQEIALWSVMATHMTGAISGWHAHKRIRHKAAHTTHKRENILLPEFRVLL